MPLFHRITDTPKKRIATLFGLGCCATLSLPPFFLFPLLAVSLCGWLALLLRVQTSKQAFWTGWWWGLGFFMSGLYWMCISLLVDAERFAWMIPFALFGLNGLIAIFPGLACLGFYCISYNPLPLRGRVRVGAYPDKSIITRPPPSLPPIGGGIIIAAFLFTVCFSISEFARSVLFTGFPWNLVGYVWAEWPSGMQAASIFGIHGLTLGTILLSLIPLLYVRGAKQAAIRIGFVWMIVLAWGMWRLDYAPVVDTTNQPTVRLVQAAIPQSLKWDPKAMASGVHKHIELTYQANQERGRADITVWPESAVPFPINKQPTLERDLRALLADNDLLITGSIRIGESLEPNKTSVYNSIYTLNKDATLHVYDKHHLVPFGEFVPLRNVLPIDKITPGDTDYSRGPGPQTVVVNIEKHPHRLRGGKDAQRQGGGTSRGHGMEDAPPSDTFGVPSPPGTGGVRSLSFSPLVCYEAIFPDKVVAANQTRPAFLVNVTNDAWFGTSTGPYQHLHMTRFRAVEQGVPLVRAANTGISAVVDSYGRITASIPLNQYGTIDAPLPPQIEPTIYVSLGNWLYIGMLIMLLVITIGCGRLKQLQL